LLLDGCVLDVLIMIDCMNQNFYHTMFVCVYVYQKADMDSVGSPEFINGKSDQERYL